MPYIVARLFGGLGNQLFIYAMARALAVRNGVPLKLDTESGFRNDRTYGRKYLLDQFNIQDSRASAAESFLFPGGEGVRRVWRKANSMLPLDRRLYLTESASRFDPSVFNLRITRPLYLEGYWQTERYFDDQKDLLREELTCTVQPSDQARSEVDQILQCKNSVAVGVRRYQEVPDKNYFTILGPDYYNQALTHMAAEFEGVHFFIVSEDIEWCRQTLRVPFPHTFISHKPDDRKAFENLWVAGQCRHFIISNSSYHWWTAWLASAPDKRVLAPSIGLTNADWVPKTWEIFAPSDEVGRIMHTQPQTWC